MTMVKMYRYILLTLCIAFVPNTTMASTGIPTTTNLTDLSSTIKPDIGAATLSSISSKFSSSLTTPAKVTNKSTLENTVQSNATSIFQNIASMIGNVLNSFSNSTTSHPQTSLPLSAMAMQNKLPGGLQSSLLPLLFGGKPMDLQSITNPFSGLSSNLPSLLKGNLLPNSSSMTGAGQKCFEDIDTYIEDLQFGQPWALKMLDASGKPGPSIMDGNLKFFGNFDECLEATNGVTTVNGQSVKGDTCVVTLVPPAQLISALGAPKGPFGAGPLPIVWHLCVPNTCHGADIKTALNSGLSKINITVSVVTCHVDVMNGPVGSDSPAVGAIVLIAVLGSLVLLGTVLDLNIRAKTCKTEKEPTTPKLDAAKLHEICKSFESDEPNGVGATIRNGKPVGINGNVEFAEKKNDSPLKLDEANGSTLSIPNGGQLRVDCEKGMARSQVKTGKSPVWQRLLLCFSAVTNGEKILNVKPTPGSLTCLNGIRVLSIGWVILGHTFSFVLNIADNPASAAKLMNNFSFQIMMNATLAVDSFFVLSGLLVTYLFLRETEKAGGIKVKHMIMYYVHRYLRLTPSYAFLIFIYTFLIRYFVDGPTGGNPMDGPQCEEYWWLNILYINNVYRTDQQCFGWGWYLANDMQFYVVAPLALVPFAFGSKSRTGFIMKIVGLCVIVGFIITSIVTTAYISYINGADLLHNPQVFFVQIYEKPWCRVGTFAIGVGVGSILHFTKSKIRISPFVQGVGWLFALVAAGACTLATYDENAPGRSAWGNGARAAHESLFRPGWGMVLGWVILMCCTGKAGIVNWMLSWDWWQPLARLTYGTYLVHPIIMQLLNMIVAKSLIHYTPQYMVLLFFGYTCLSYIFAFILAILVEAPLLQLEKMLLSK